LKKFLAYAIMGKSKEISNENTGRTLSEEEVSEIMI
jgi:hypothetical protein